MSLPKILIVDDEPAVRVGTRIYLEEHGYQALEASTIVQARMLFQRERPDAVILDYSLPDGTTLGILDEMHSIDPHLPIVILTGHGTIDLAVRAIKDGAENFLTKPVELPVLRVILERALENQRARRRQVAQTANRRRSGFDPFVGTSSAIHHFSAEAQFALRSDGPILILGETGSGKGVLARWFHEEGARRDESFVDLNCAGFSREFLESELFGHTRGAFTGAISEKKGLFEVAHKGTLFLDEVGDFDLALQPKVLKVLEEKRFRKMGEVTDRVADVFLIAATNHDLPVLVREGRFRSDLFFRISTFPITVPPLRERAEDIPMLADQLLKQLRSDLSRPSLRLTPAAVAALRAYRWPGNVRELRNVLERAALRAADGEIQPSDLSFANLQMDPTTASPAAREGGTLAEIERREIERALTEEQGRVSAAAKRLGLARSTLYDKLREHAIDLAKFQKKL